MAQGRMRSTIIFPQFFKNFSGQSISYIWDTDLDPGLRIHFSIIKFKQYAANRMIDIIVSLVLLLSFTPCVELVSSINPFRRKISVLTGLP